MKHTMMASCLIAAVACSTGAMAGGMDASHDHSASSTSASSHDSLAFYEGSAKTSSYSSARKRYDWYVGGALVGSKPTGQTSRAKTILGALDLTAKGKFSPGASLMVGRRLGDNVRVEGELLYRNFKYDKTIKVNGQDIGITGKDTSKGFGGLVNVYYDFLSGQKLRPYIGGGLGYMSLSGKSDAEAPGVQKVEAKYKAKGFIYQVGLGASYALTSQWDAFGGYRYLVGSKIKARIKNSGQTVKGHMKAHEVMLGLRYNF